MQLEPPFLVVRPGVSFWVETRPLEDCSATLQAFRAGCFLDAWCYDPAGGGWPILEATLQHRPSPSDEVLPWTHVGVALRLGPRIDADIRSVVAQLALVLRSGNEFCESLRTPPADVLDRFQRARTTAEIIGIAREYQ